MATKHVQKTGSADSGSAGPFLTINYGLTQIVGGDTLVVHAGSYDESITTAPSGPNASNYTKIQNNPGDTVTLKPSSGNIAVDFFISEHYIEFDGINIDATSNVLGAPVFIEEWEGGQAHHIRFKNATWILGSDGVPNQGTNGGPIGAICSGKHPTPLGGNEFIDLIIHGGGDSGDFSYSFYLQSPNNLVQRCEMYDNSGAGIQIYNGYQVSDGAPAPTGNIIDSCYIHDQTRTPDTRIWGIIIAGNTNTVQNTVCSRVGGITGGGFYAYVGTGNKFYNCCAYNGTTYGFYVDTGSTATVILNCIGYLNGTNYGNAGTGTLYGGVGGTHNITNGTNPGWIDPAGGNFRITSSSPAYHAGEAIGTLTTDKAGAAYFNPPSMGAYEVGVATTDIVIGDNTGSNYIGTSDTSIHNDAPTTNDGALGNLNIWKYSPGFYYNTLIKFDALSNIPVNATITDASLFLYLNGAGGDTSTITARRLLLDWTEAGATWTTRNGVLFWGTAGATNDTDRSATISGTAAIANAPGQFFELTGSQFIADVQGFVSGTYSNYGWHLERTDSADDFWYQEFNSSEAADGTRPYLTVSYTTPSSSSVVVLMLHNRMRRN